MKMQGWIALGLIITAMWLGFNVLVVYLLNRQKGDKKTIDN